MYAILQIIISVVVVYLVFSIVVYVVAEWLEGMIKLRGRMLRKAVINLFQNKELGELIYNHPQLDSLKETKGKRPSYIPASNLAQAVIDTIGARANTDPSTRINRAYKNFVDGVSNMDDRDFKTRELLISLAQHSSDIKELTATIESWFNNAMDRLTGWYKRTMRLILLGIASVVTVGFNIDTIHIIKAAKADPVLRQKMNDLGDKILADSMFMQLVNEQRADLDYYEDYVNDSSIHENECVDCESTESVGCDDCQQAQSNFQSEPDVRLNQFLKLNQFIKDSDLPIGWGINKDSSGFMIALGWVITALALSAGAPFWFDALKYLVNIRSSGIKPLAPKK